MAASITSLVEETESEIGYGYRREDCKFEQIFTVGFSKVDSFNRIAALTATFGGLTIPQPGSFYPNTSFVVEKVLARRKGQTGRNWRVYVNYLTSALNTLGNQQPWNTRPLIGYGTAKYQFAMDYDLSGPGDSPAGPRAVRNSANDPFDPGVTTIRKNLILKIHMFKILGSYDPDLNSNLVGTLNLFPLQCRTRLIAASKALLLSQSAEELIWWDNNHYWDITLEIEVEQQVALASIFLQNKGYFAYATGGDATTKGRIGVNTATGGITVITAANKANCLPAASPQFIKTDGSLWTDFSTEPTALAYKPHATTDWTSLALTGSLT